MLYVCVICVVHIKNLNLSSHFGRFIAEEKIHTMNVILNKKHFTQEMQLKAERRKNLPPNNFCYHY